MHLTAADIERFYSFFADYDEDECWPFLGSFNNKGYGNFWCNGRTECAHRVSYHIHVGDIPEGMILLHSCDNTICCNPLHLSVGTHQDNTDDKVAKGRHLRPVREAAYALNP